MQFVMDADDVQEGQGTTTVTSTMKERDTAIMDYISTATAVKLADNQPKIWCLVTQRDDVCYSFKFKEDAKGQDVMDEVLNLSYFGFSPPF